MPDFNMHLLKLRVRTIHEGLWNRETQIPAHGASEHLPEEEHGLYTLLWAHLVLTVFPRALGYWLLLEIGCWDRWTLFRLRLAILGFILCSCFLCSCKKYTHDVIFQRVKAQPERNRWHCTTLPAPNSLHTRKKKQQKNLEMTGRGSLFCKFLTQ